jgi:endonuclease/exonuclease/phosphatase family metal-dependent hydrolase
MGTNTNRIVMAILSTMVFSLAGCSCGQPRTIQFPPSQGDQIKAMTFNIRTATMLDLWNHWVFRRQGICQTITANAPDIFGVQEAQPSQVSDIEKVLPQYSSYSVGRVNGRQRGETNAVFYRRDRFTLLDSGTFWFSDKPDKPGSRGWGNIFPRICSWVYLRERNTGEGLYVYNMHLDVFSQRSRANSIALLAAHVKARRTNDPFILMGDFNMKDDNPAMALLDEMGCYSAGFGKQLAAAVATGKDIGTRHEFMGSCPRIDHIRLSKGLRGNELTVDRRRVNGGYPSDHYPITALVRLGSTLVAKQ